MTAPKAIVAIEFIILAGAALPNLNSFGEVQVMRCGESLPDIIRFLQQPSALLIVTSAFLHGTSTTAFWESVRMHGALVGVAYDPEAEDGFEFVTAGCSALVPYRSTEDELSAILHTLAIGDLAIPVSTMSRALRHCLADSAAVLTAREQEVFRHACSGLSNHQIAEQLDISRDTVRWHLRSINAKLGHIDLRRRIH